MITVLRKVFDLTIAVIVLVILASIVFSYLPATGNTATTTAQAEKAIELAQVLEADKLQEDE